MSYITAIKFLLSALNDEEKNIKSRAINLVTEKGLDFDVDIYEPNKKCFGTILFIHGMNRLGAKDARVIKISNVLASIGYRVIAPTYPVFTNHLVDAQSREDIAETIKTITKDKSLCTSGKVAIFTASFSGFFTLCVAKREDVRHLISSICSVGTCYYAKSTFKNILAEKTEDYYAKGIAIKNLLRINNELTPVLEQGMECIIADAFDTNTQEAFNNYVLTLAAPEKEQLQKIFSAIKNQEDLNPQYETHIQKMHDVFMVHAGAQGITSHVTLIHSENDKILHTVESRQLYNELKACHVPSHLVITPLLDHADMHFSFKYVADVWRLLRAFNLFFKKV